jgi:hypothetical protein
LRIDQLEGAKVIYTDEIREGIIVGMKDGMITVGTKPTEVEIK